MITRKCTVALLSLMSCVACSGGSSGSGTARVRSSTLTVFANARAAPAMLEDLVVGGGTIELETAQFSIAEISIEEETESGGEGGEHGEEPGGEENGKGGEPGEGPEDEEIVITGPFAIDIASGSAVLASVPVFPGTFREANIVFHRDPLAPFSGGSVYFRGQYFPTTGDAIPITLRSDFAGEIEVPIANGGITVGSNMTMPIVLTFALDSLFAGMDFATATVSGGEILIDATNNVQLLDRFEQNLAETMELEEGEG
jgi:hypothetical protein